MRLRPNAMPLHKKILHTLRQLDKATSWATHSFLLSFMSWLPIIFATRQFAETTVYYLAPRIRITVFSLASVGLLACMLMSFMLLPHEKVKYPFFKRILRSFEWLLIPIVILVLSALPALDAQTRLMFGRYMEFWVTDKYRLKEQSS